MLAQLSGETLPARVPLPVRSGFAYRKKTGRREYVRVRLTPGPEGVTAHKHEQDGAGVLTSLTETAGLIELPEAVTRVAAGDSVGFLPYASLL